MRSFRVGSSMAALAMAPVFQSDAVSVAKTERQEEPSKLTGKQQRKLRKRAHIAAAIATQNQWIEETLCVATDSQPERHRLFAQARAILEKKNATR